MFYLSKYLPELYLSTPSLTVGRPKYQTISDSTYLAGGAFVVAWKDTQSESGVTRSEGAGATIFDSFGKVIASQILDPGSPNFFSGEHKPSLTTLSSGNWLAAWSHTDSTMGGALTSAAYAAIFTPTGQLLGSQIMIRPQTSSLGAADLSSVVVTALSGDRFVATWTQREALGFPFTFEIRGQIYSGTGQAIGPQFSVETGSPTVTPIIALLANDRFISAWTYTDQSQHTQIKAQIFDASGGKVGSTLSLAVTSQMSATAKASIAGLANGTFVLVWNDSSGDSDIRGQIFNAAGQAIGAQFTVNATLSGDQTAPQIVVLPDDSFVISWTDTSHVGGDNSQSAIKLRHFDSTGAALGTDVLVNTFIAGGQSDSSLTLLSDGKLFVSWTDSNRAASDTTIAPGINGQIFTLSSDAPSPRQLHNDINRDGNSDILFFRAGGLAAAWETDGSHIRKASAIGALDPGMTIVGTGDFDGDRQCDFVLRASDGTIALWEMNGTRIKLAAGVGTPAEGFAVAGTGDFNGDYKSDVLLERSDGFLALWEMNGATVTREAGIGSLPSTFKVADIGDFNGDMHSDILMLSASGDLAIWQMDGSTINLAAGIGALPSGNTIAGIGDFDGDGKADILFQDGAGVVSMWEMDGSTIKLAAGVGVLPSGFEIAGSGDFNGDGRADILLRNGAGFVATWEMDGATVKMEAGVGALGTDWFLL
ncbi:MULTISPECIES: VCBS repeat-containing protein [unclassified Bosea (in: a-proteobacteria)]|uniref:FG-GAP repeat domain-containing protein n=1 Tax=unclassified Bosea (in: a-proteobacteria) TaxID=2653178 RepID=UPI000F75A380|nr:MULTISPECIES: VCBS repeat-containing protein [unclassified Bosea (in: a-proteobacteria)]AZO79704.1 hypothetical protein BLM15_20445 [Bosea sp. Tri-49]RXT16043.1 hypothetical protein B5U98_28945 [Bosea sp. Tri-39]RXT39736.1 hypothetical protein B5U99_05990 [Bosea sp. Tri-54]